MSIDLNMPVTELVSRVRSTVGICPLTEYTLVDVTGEDAERFLQNRLSNDVLALQPGQGHLNAVLDRQGKIEGVFSLHRTENGFFLLVYAPEVDSTVKGILKYKIIERVELKSQAETLTLIACQGPLSAELMLKAAAHPEMLADMREFGFVESSFFGLPVRVIRRSLLGEDGFVLAVSPEHAETLWQCLHDVTTQANGAVITPEAWNILRVEAGQPLFGQDYDTETLLPETGLERQAVSYSKGCYLGQETIARIKTYGMVQKALVGLLFEPDAPLPPVGSECLLADKPVGVIKSGVFSPALQRPIALAYLGRSERVPGKRLNLEIAGQAFSVTVTLLPFVDSGKERSGSELLAEGLKLFSEGFEEEATRLLRRAIEADPQLVEAYEALGVILSRQDKYQEAIGLMEHILTLDPDHVLAHTNLSVFYMRLGDKEKAEEEKAKATTAAFSKKMRESGLSFDPEAERLKKEAATRERIAMFLEALKFSPEDPLGNFGLGSSYLELKQYAEAIAPFERVIKAQPKHTVAYLSLGKALEGAGQSGTAAEIYRQGIEVAAAKGDLMPLREMQTRLEALE